MWENHPIRPEGIRLSPKIRAALEQMATALAYAEDLGVHACDFAAEMHGLDLTPNDLRWLIAKGYVKHLQETTRRDANRRSFRSGGRTTFAARSCFLLTEAGLSLLRVADEASYKGHADALDGDAFAPRLTGPREANAIALPLPRWDCDRRELWVGARLVKQFRQRSANQETVLAAFEEEGWPCSIDDPLPPRPKQDPKRRLHDTIRSLNRRQKHRLIRFVGDGTGQRVIWERTGPAIS